MIPQYMLEILSSMMILFTVDEKFDLHGHEANDINVRRHQVCIEDHELT